jgi:large subunit ribosomal protein L24
MIYRATYTTKSKQLGSALSKDLHKKYGKRSVRVIEGDSIKIVRGEFKGVDGKISKISTQKSSVSIEGIKKEKTKGDKFDVHIHTSNLVVTSLNTGDKWRMAKLEGKDPKKQSKEELKEKPVKEELKEKPVKEELKEKPVKEELKEKPVKEELKEKPVKEELKEKPVKEELVKKVSKETKEVKKTEKKEDEK